jgi:hypothetical protein
MPNDLNDYYLEHLLGKADVPRLTNPTLVSGVRRNDPDGVSAVPYFPSLTGKKLSVSFTDSSLTVLGFEVTFASNSYQAAIDTINAGSVANVEAVDVNGYLVLRNKNQGKTHFIQVNAASSSEGAGVLGFRTVPYPGHISAAGDLTSSPPTRQQGNGLGTSLLAGGEDLDSSAINRSIVGIAEQLGRLLRFQDKEQIGQTEISIAALRSDVGSFHIITPTSVDLVRLPLDRRLFPASADPEAAQPGSLDQFFNVVDSTGADVYYLGTKVKVTGVIYYNPATFSSIDLAHAFSTWLPGGPGSQAKSIYYSSVVSPTEGQYVTQVTKHAAASIDSIDGNVLKCGTATFVSNLVQPGDTCIIQSSTNDLPFNHNGEYVIERVFDETHIAVRPKARIGAPLTNLDYAEEAAVFTANSRPQALNYVGLSAGFGQVVVPIGNFLPARNIGYITNLPVAASTGILLGGKLRVASGKIERLADPNAFSKKITGSAQQVMTFVQNLVSQLNNASDVLPSIDSAFSTSLDSPKILWRVHAAPNSGPFPGTGIFARLYSLDGNDYTLAINAARSGSSWVEDNTAIDGLILSVGRTGVVLQTHTGGAGAGVWVTTLTSDKTNTSLSKTLQLALATATPLIKARSTGATTGRTWLGAVNDTVNPSNLYVNQSTGNFEIVTNAEWNGTQWTRPSSGAKSSKVEISKTGIRVLIRSTTGTIWTDSDGDWDDSIVVAGKFLSSNSLPSFTTPIYNQLHNTNTPKAWGTVRVQGNTGTMNPSIVNGFNIASVSQEGSSTSIVRVTFAASLDVSVSYGVIISGRITRSPAIFGMPTIGGKTLSFFDFSFQKSDGTTYDFSDANGPDATVDFVVFGP